MRVLAAFKSGSCPKGILEKSIEHGFVVDEIPYVSSEGIIDALDFNKNPYTFLFHDQNIQEDLSDHVAVTISSVKPDFINATSQGRFDPDTLIRQAYLKLSERLDDNSEGLIYAGHFEINLLEGRAKVDGKPLELTSRAFSGLRALCVYGRGKLLHPEDLFQIVYGTEAKEELSACCNLISRLNKKIVGIAGEDFIIKSYANSGYAVESVGVDSCSLVGNMMFSRGYNILTNGEKEILLAPKASEILDFLLKNKGKGFLGKVISERLDIPFNSLGLYFKKIRNAMIELSGHNYVRNVGREGYSLSDNPVPVKPDARRKVAGPS